MAKTQASAEKLTMPGRYPFRVMSGWRRRCTVKGQEVFSHLRVSNLYPALPLYKGGQGLLCEARPDPLPFYSFFFL